MPRTEYWEESTAHSWEVLRCAKDYSKRRDGQGRLWSSRVAVWGNYLLMQKNKPFFRVRLFHEESLSTKPEAQTRYWAWGTSSHLLCQAQHAHSTFLSTTCNSLILLAAVTPTGSVPLAYKMPFQIKLLFSLIKHQIWAKTASPIQLNPHCLQLLSRAECTEISQRPRCLVTQTPVSCN